MPGRVLVVAHSFPPVGGVGILRTLKFVKYLPDSGWEPIVLTARNPGAAIRDEDSERSLPADLRVERAFSPEPTRLRRGLGRLVRRGIGLSGSRADRAEATAAPAPGGGTPPARPNPWSSRLSALWVAAVRATFFPDEQVLWVPFAVRSGLAIHSDTPIDAVYSSSAPISCHLAAALIAKKAGVPWVADFRDPWIGHTFAVEPGRLHADLRRRIERRIVHLADRLVFPTPGVAEAYATRYQWAADRIVVIPNGYDRGDLPTRVSVPRSAGDGRFHLVYGGSVHGERELEVFLDGLELLVARRPLVRDRLAVDFIGWQTLHNQAVAARYATPDRLGSMLSFAGFLPHTEAVARMAAADALLTVIGDGPDRSQIQGGKLTEYVGLDLPVLAVVPEGDARALLRELGWGIVADPTPEGVARGLEELLATPRPTGRADPDGRYDRVNLTRRLAAVLDDAIAGSAPTRP
jgi:glycosyltransferase involved in cell wall biosynthesis